MSANRIYFPRSEREHWSEMSWVFQKQRQLDFLIMSQGKRWRSRPKLVIDNTCPLAPATPPGLIYEMLTPAEVWLR